MAEKTKQQNISGLQDASSNVGGEQSTSTALKTINLRGMI